MYQYDGLSISSCIQAVFLDMISSLTEDGRGAQLSFEREFKVHCDWSNLQKLIF